MLIEMAIKGLMMDPITNLPIVILKDPDGQRVLPIWVGAVEANAVALQIENVAPPRPLTHDLVRSILQELGATLTRVVIHDLRESTFYAYLELRQGSETTLVDVRPERRIGARAQVEGSGICTPAGARARLIDGCSDGRC